MLRLLLIFAPALAGASTLTISLDAVPARVAAHHPDLAVARFSIAEAEARLAGAGRLNNPVASLDWRPQNRLNPAVATFAFEQQFPVTRRLALEKQLSRQEVAAAVLEVRDVERRLVGEAREAAVALMAAGERAALAAGQAALAKKFAEDARARAERGEAPATDAAQADLEAARAAVEAERRAAERGIGEARLKPLLGVPAGDSLTLSGGLPDPARDVSGQAWERRPDYQLARARCDAADTAAALEKARRWDDWSAGLTGGPEYQRSGGSTTTSGYIGVRLSVPLPLWNRNEAGIAAAGIRAARSRGELEALGARIAAEAATARREMEASASLVVRMQRELLPAAAAATAQTEKAWSAGEAPLSALFRAREQELQIRIAVLDARRDHHLARIRFEAATAARP